MFVNRRTLDRPAGQGLASCLASHGFETWMVDLRGHGESGPAAGHGGRWSYDDIVRFDLPETLRWLKQQYSEQPLFLVGHSLSAHAGVAALGVDRTLPVDGLVSLGGNVWMPSLEPSRRLWAKKWAAMRAWGLVARLHGHFPARAYHAGTDAEALGYVQQLVDGARRDRWGSRDGRHDYLRLMAHVETPILSVVGRGDNLLCTPESARRWLAGAVRADVSLRVVAAQAGSEGPVAIGHMGLVTQREMATEWDRLADWMTAHFPRSGA